ncbi:MAG: 2-isopropylmalate synthase, partial [Defluviitaleaceae bacterium]|nr:2-isopropylmalate synthase [Defluviitaleaceae bacterium]
MNHFKYKKPAAFDFPQRSWPGKTLSKAPAWCSVDLRDGNQSLNVPMLLDEKLEFFKFLCETGFKEIEIGFPSANETEFKFARELITRRLIPDNVSVQVLTQSRGHIIERTFEALEGVKQAIVHLYNSTSPLQREVVFKKSKDEIISLAVNGAVQMVALAERYGSERFMFEYSPESFSQTEPDFAVEICNAVTDVWRGKKIIINLPFTVETCLPNVHADQIEYMCGRLNGRDNLTVSLHAHNDRGTAVAATELGLLAGADRVEGTLFGNGERTGNADIITLAMNLFSHGIDPKLDFSKIDKAIDIYEKSTGLRVHQRHPYAGDLVYTAFSGSHQDAIRKGMHRMADSGCGVSFWNVPYLPIDPCDVGRSYDPIIRVNSQSGGAATAYVLERNFGINMPKRMYRD